jgi:hypothetical protein
LVGAGADGKMFTATKKGAAVLDQHIPDHIKKAYHVLQVVCGIVYFLFSCACLLWVCISVLTTVIPVPITHAHQLDLKQSHEPLNSYCISSGSSSFNKYRVLPNNRSN